jgi:hypothetical protein
MSLHGQLAHQLAAGFLEQASLYAAKVGQENIESAMRTALANLVEEVRQGVPLVPGIDLSKATATREAVLLACQLVTATLTADTRTVN